MVQPSCTDCSQFTQSLRDVFINGAHILARDRTGDCVRNHVSIHLPNYRQKVKWYFDCIHCEYRSFYAHEIEDHVTKCHPNAKKSTSQGSTKQRTYGRSPKRLNKGGESKVSTDDTNTVVSRSPDTPPTLSLRQLNSSLETLETNDAKPLVTNKPPQSSVKLNPEGPLKNPLILIVPSSNAEGKTTLVGYPVLNITQSGKDKGGKPCTVAMPTPIMPSTTVTSGKPHQSETITEQVDTAVHSPDPSNLLTLKRPLQGKSSSARKILKKTLGDTSGNISCRTPGRIPITISMKTFEHPRSIVQGKILGQPPDDTVDNEHSHGLSTSTHLPSPRIELSKFSDILGLKQLNMGNRSSPTQTSTTKSPAAKSTPCQQGYKTTAVKQLCTSVVSSESDVNQADRLGDSEESNKSRNSVKESNDSQSSDSPTSSLTASTTTTTTLSTSASITRSPESDSTVQSPVVPTTSAASGNVEVSNQSTMTLEPHVLISRSLWGSSCGSCSSTKLVTTTTDSKVVATPNLSRTFLSPPRKVKAAIAKEQQAKKVDLEDITVLGTKSSAGKKEAVRYGSLAFKSTGGQPRKKEKSRYYGSLAFKSTGGQPTEKKEAVRYGSLAFKSTGGQPRKKEKARYYGSLAFKSTGGQPKKATTATTTVTSSAIVKQTNEEQLPIINSVYSMAKDSNVTTETTSVNSPATNPLPVPSNSSKDTHVTVPAEKLEPLHVSTTFTPLQVVSSLNYAQSPGEDVLDSDPWPSPSDPLSPPYKLPNTLANDTKPGSKATSQSIDSSPIVSAPLLTIGTSMSSPSSPFLSPRKLYSRMNKKLTRKQILFALRAFNPPASSSLQSGTESQRVVELLSDRYTQPVKYVHDKSIQFVKHFCKHNPVQLHTVHTSEIGDTIEDISDFVWPGPILSDEEMSTPLLPADDTIASSSQSFGNIPRKRSMSVASSTGEVKHSKLGS